MPADPKQSTVHVYYPSGSNFEVEGEWVGCCHTPPGLPDGPLNLVLVRLWVDGKAKECFFDPRGCFVDTQTG
jgi:hypothetical protein